MLDTTVSPMENNQNSTIEEAEDQPFIEILLLIRFWESVYLLRFGRNCTSSVGVAIG